MSFLRHREIYRTIDLVREEPRYYRGSSRAHLVDEFPVGYSWRVALQHCPIPRHQPLPIVRDLSTPRQEFFEPAR